MRHIILIIILICLAVTLNAQRVIHFPWVEGFEGNVFPPDGWLNIDNDEDDSDDPRDLWRKVISGPMSGVITHEGIAFAASTSMNHRPNNWLITPKISLPPESGVELTYWVRSRFGYDQQTGKNFKEHYGIFISTTDTEIGNGTDEKVGDFTHLFDEEIDDVWTEKLIYLNDYAGEDVYIAFRHYDSNDRSILYLDHVSISLYEILDYDLKAVNLTQKSLFATQNEPHEFSFTVRNPGSNNATDYTLKLMQIGVPEPLTEIHGSALNTKETETFILSYTFSTVGNINVYAEIEWSLDNNVANNKTPEISVYVRSKDYIYIGDQNSIWAQHYPPFSYFFLNSVAQIIYLESELGEPGIISQLSYRFNGSGNIPENHNGKELTVKIWMGHTELTSFRNDLEGPLPWIPSEQQILVYEGPLPVHDVGWYNIDIDLNESFRYQGKNLVITTQRLYLDTDAWWGDGYNDDVWQLTDVDDHRALLTHSDHIDLTDPENWDEGVTSRRIPNIGLNKTAFDSSSENDLLAPAKTELASNFPNPFNPETTIKFTLMKKSHVNVKIYNIKGQEIKTLVNKEMETGSHFVVWNGKDKNNHMVSSGVYFYQVKIGEFNETRKMLLLK